MKKIKPDWEGRVEIYMDYKNNLTNQKVLYFRHIARNKKFPSIGIKLEEQMYQLARESGFKSVIGEILDKPYSNEISKKVHKERGFKKIGKIHYKDNYLWGIYEKSLKLLI